MAWLLAWLKAGELDGFTLTFLIIAGAFSAVQATKMMAMAALTKALWRTVEMAFCFRDGFSKSASHETTMIRGCQ